MADRPINLPAFRCHFPLPKTGLTVFVLHRRLLHLQKVYRTLINEFVFQRQLEIS